MTAATSSTPLSARTRLFYGFGSVAFGVKDNGFSYFLLIFYNQVVGLPSQTVGLAIMLALVFDAFLDPIVGQLSDNWRSKWGRRHPFMYAAALPVAVSYALLWNPPAWSQEALFFYLLFSAILIRSFITLYEIPSAALAAELTEGYDERTRLLSYRYLFGWGGGIAMFFAALTIFLKPQAGEAVGQLNREGYSAYGYAAAGLMLFAIIVSAVGTHREIGRLKAPPQRNATLGTLAKEMVGTLSHRSFLSVLFASLFTSMAGGLVLSINIYFATYFWGLSSGQLAAFAAATFASAVLAFLLARPISARLGKKRATMLLVLGAVVVASAPVLMRLAGVGPANGAPELFWLLFAQTMVSTAFSIGASILISSMIADVVEDSELRTGRRSEGLFFAASAFISKAVTGIGIFASALLLRVVGFPEQARPGEVPEEVIRNLGLVYVPTIAVIYGLGMLILTGYRITRESHAEAVRKLAAAADLAAEGEPAGSQGKLG